MSSQFLDVEIESYYRLLHPRPVVIVTSTCPEGKGNAMACSWFTPVSEEPPIVAIAIAKENYTCECIKFCKAFAINIVHPNLYDKVWFFGSRSGREVDKLKTSGLKFRNGKKINVPIIEDSLGVIETKLINEIEAGECILFLGEVVATYAKKESLTKYGWKLDKAPILMHGWGRVFYVLDSRARKIIAK